MGRRLNKNNKTTTSTQTMNKRKPPRYRQGRFKPLNPKKYMGDTSKIDYRSGWELKCMKHFDTASYVLGWSSEEIVVTYLSPKDGKFHRYYPDFLIVTLDENKEKKVTMIEVKPEKENYPPKSKGKKKSRYLQEAITYEVNQAKWKYAREYCEKRGWNFVVMTEKEIF